MHFKKQSNRNINDRRQFTVNIKKKIYRYLYMKYECKQLINRVIVIRNKSLFFIDIKIGKIFYFCF